MSDSEKTDTFDSWVAVLRKQAPDLSVEELRSVWDEKPVTIPLDKPVEFASVHYTELTFQPLTASMMSELPLGFGGPGVGKLGDLFSLAARQAGIPSPVLDKLSPSDLRRITNLSSAFFAVSQGIGAPQ